MIDVYEVYTSGMRLMGYDDDEIDAAVARFEYNNFVNWEPSEWLVLGALLECLSYSNKGKVAVIDEVVGEVLLEQHFITKDQREVTERGMWYMTNRLADLLSSIFGADCDGDWLVDMYAFGPATGKLFAGGLPFNSSNQTEEEARNNMHIAISNLTSAGRMLEYYHGAVKHYEWEAKQREQTSAKESLTK